ncbi:hypothetical protein [Maribacter sp. 2304DJ31-5]|uniref:hypothetical protein n=1 Tax=Maribacter sp. 2304DJ31-5 TaxID=3386273 RepID=UPI0039BCEB8A
MGFEEIAIPKKHILNPYFSDSSKDYVYKAVIKIHKRTFGGVLAIKKIASQEHRIVFATEMGNTLFDFSFKGNTFKINRILKEMDKKILVNILKKDFEALIKEKPVVIKYYSDQSNILIETKIGKNSHFYSFGEERLKQIIRVGPQKEQVIFSFSEINDNIAQHIKVLHKNLNLQITLNAF